MLLRDSILDGMREQLLVRDWSSITLTDVARAAGISRQTIYNEFGSRQGLAEGYALRLADRLVDAVAHAINRNVGQSTTRSWRLPGLLRRVGIRPPLVISLLTGAAKPDLLQIITIGSGPIISRCSTRLQETFQSSWIRSSDEDAGGAGACHRPAGHELRVHAAGSRP